MLTLSSWEPNRTRRTSVSSTRSHHRVTSTGPLEVIPGRTTLNLEAATLEEGELTFGGWGGACTGTGSCVVVMNGAQTVIATFNPPQSMATLTVSQTGTGSGTVTSSPAGINCGATCSAGFPNGTSVTLSAAAVSGWARRRSIGRWKCS